MNPSDWQTSCPTIQDANSHLLKSGKFGDVVFLVGKTKVQVHAHKLILMSRSSVFEAMFERWETETKCQIEIPDVTHKSFQLFLEYLYSNTFSVTGEDAVEVLYLAQKYYSNDLAELCSNLLKSSIQIGNAVQILKVASEFNQVALHTQAMEFLRRNGKSIFEDVQFLEIDSKTLSTILKDDLLVVDELTVFRAVMKWADNTCNAKKLDKTVKNRRTILTNLNLFHLIRFPVMRAQDFTNEVVRQNEGFLTESETIGIYVDITTPSSEKSNLPATPFNRNQRRCLDVYSVQPYGSVNPKTNKSSCREYSGTPLDYECISTQDFISNENIYLNGLEMHWFEQFRQLRHEKILEFVTNSKWTVSVKSFEGPTMSSIVVTSEQMNQKSTIKIEFDSPIPILKNCRYYLELSFIGGADGLRRINSTCGAHKSRKSSEVICRDANTTLGFGWERTRCGPQTVLGHRGIYDDEKPPICISSGQLKTIYFTL